MHAVHVIAGLDPKNGGPAYSVPRTCEALVAEGCGAEILCVSEDGDASSAEYRRSFTQDLRWLPMVGALRMSTELNRALSQLAPQVDVLHNHGLWLMPNVEVGRIAIKARKPLIVSPRGMLAPEALKFSYWKKKAFWLLLQKHAFAEVAAWHATSEEEAEDIRSFGIKKPIAVIPNGVDLPGAVATHAPERTPRTLLFLSRVHPKKGLPELIRAWASISTQRQDWRLVIAGPDEVGHRAELERLASDINAERIVFFGPAYGAEKEALLERADLFVLPTKSENFGIAVAEALATGVPSIVTKGAPWRGLEVKGCGWWIDHGIESLGAAILEATGRSSDDRKKMGIRGRAWMEKDFEWRSVAAQTIELYEWVTAGGERPSFVL